MSEEELYEGWEMSQRANNPPEPEEEVFDTFRLKVHDLSFVVGNFEQRFLGLWTGG